MQRLAGYKIILHFFLNSRAVILLHYKYVENKMPLFVFLMLYYNYI